MKIFKKIIGISAALICIFMGILTIYSADYYRADEEKLNNYISEGLSEGVTYSVDENIQIFSSGNDEKNCVIFYPGAKVDAEAYAPLCIKLAENGIDCVIVNMPYKLAFFGINSADKVMKSLESLNIENYYIAGHSLGGVAASYYADKNSDKLSGVILLASYSTKNLTDNGIPVLSVYGNYDGILDMNAYEKNIRNIWRNLDEVVIDGGNHAYFGTYGSQKGDTEAEITNDRQIEITAQAITEFIEKAALKSAVFLLFVV